ncbi:uncharacterized protein, partial [Amphiura filiformis]|uniref:uncharacterized protein n=1 Tax=Amphiura filiformis TaxID=82378 RepID=UPI003B21D1CF
SLGYETSKALADLLNPLIGNTEHHVKNSKELAEDLSGVCIEDNEIFNSHDVVSLFTNTPIKEALDVIKKRLVEDKYLKLRTKLEVDDIIELLEFILTTTYFEFRGDIFRQRFGAAMGSPVSPIIANFFMEFLEQQAIATAPIDCKPRYWRRYVDDVLEIIKAGQVQNLTDHLNTIDKTDSIKFTYEEEKEGKIPFLDTLIVRKPDGSVKLLVYRKPTHTDQYLSFKSEHPLHQKMGVVRTLFDRMYSVVTDEKDRANEEKHVRGALKNCGYPKWAVDQVKSKMQRKTKPAVKPTAKKDQKNEDKSKGMVVLPYVNGISERVQRIFKKHKVDTAMKPHQTLKKFLVHPKDKRDKLKTGNCIYEIGCQNCDLTYVGETSRLFGIRLAEHKAAVNKANEKKFTRSERRASEQEQTKSAISDHVARANHVVNWDDSKILGKEHVRKSREGIK